MNEHVKSKGNPFIAFFRGIFTGVILALYLLALTLIPALLIWATGGVLMGAIATSAPMSIGKFVFPAVDQAWYLRLPLWALLVLGTCCILLGIIAEITRVTSNHGVTTRYSLDSMTYQSAKPQIDTSVLPQMSPAAFGQELRQRLNTLIYSTEACIQSDAENPSRSEMQRLLSRRASLLSVRPSTLGHTLENLFSFWGAWLVSWGKILVGLLIGLLASMLVTGGIAMLIQKYAHLPHAVEVILTIILFALLLSGPAIGVKIAAKVDISELRWFWQERFGPLHCKLFYDGKIRACDAEAVRVVAPLCAQAQRNCSDMATFLKVNNAKHPVLYLSCFSSLLKGWSAWRIDWQNNRRYGELATDVCLERLLTICASCQTWGQVESTYHRFINQSADQFEESLRQEQARREREEAQKRAAAEIKKAEEALALQRELLREKQRHHDKLEQEAARQTEELEKLRKIQEYEQWKRNYDEIHGK